MSHSMENRFGSPLRFAPGEYLQRKQKRSALETSVVVTGTSTGMNLTGPFSGKFIEKEQMHGLNDRLAGFIEKVHHLEYQNHLLEREIEEIRGSAKTASCLEEEYGPELGKLRQLVRDISHQKHQIEIEHANLDDELSDLRRRHEQEARSRSDAEGNIVLLKKDISDAYQAKLQLDKKAQALVDEIHLLKRNHEAELSEMFDQIQDAQLTVRAHEFGNPGVTAALRDIRAQLEGHTVSDLQQVEETFRSQFARLTEAAEAQREALKATQQEIQEYRRRLQAKNIELDCAKGTREALEKQLHDIEDRHREEMIHYQNTIKELENELINCKFDMSGYLREYQDLLNVKMALDVEILSYRKLLCGEEARLSTMSDTRISLPYIYHQSPIYTLPCLSRPGGPHRRAEPQYKFVEEIITETTREIEMSEFEETGSEETEVGKDEQECIKRGGSEEEKDTKDGREEEGERMCDSEQIQPPEETGSEETEVGKDEQECIKRGRGGNEEEKDNKDDREEEGEQMSDSEQIQIAWVGNSVNGCEVNDGEKGEKSKGDETEVPNEGSSGENTQSQVLLSEKLDEEENEQDEEVAENTNTEKEAAVTKATDQKGLSLKADDLKPKFPAEEECLNKSDGKKGDAEKDSLISAQAKKPVDETSAKVSKESDKTQELNSAVQVQDKLRTLVSETAEKTTDFTAETKSDLSTETNAPSVTLKTQVSSSTITKSEEKQNCDTEPKHISKSEAAKGEDEVVKSIQDANHGSNKDQDEESFHKSYAKNLPEMKDQKPKGDKTPTVQTESPKEKTTVNAEIKELHQAAPESSQVQKSKLSEVSEKINDPQGKSEKTKSSKLEK